jgi:mannosyltransferase
MRFHALDRQSLWDDEMSTVKTISTPLAELRARFCVYEMHPPLFFLQLRVWQKVFGHSLKVWRTNSAFWGTLNLALLFFLASRYLGVSGGLAAMALMTFSPYHLAYSQEMRPYVLAMTEGILGLILLEIALERPEKIRRWLGLGVVWTSLLYTHYWGSFVVLAQASYGWMEAAEETRKKLWVVFLASSVLFCLWLPTLWSQLHYIGGLSFWMPHAAPVNLAETFVAFTGLFFHHASLAFRAPGPTVMNVFLGLFYLGILGLGISRGPRSAGIWLLMGVTLPYLISYFLPGLYLAYRYPSLMYPAFLILVASGIQGLPGRTIRAGALSALLLVGMGSCLIYATNWQKANPKMVMAYVQSLKQPNTVVIRPVYFSPLFNYYDPGSTVVIDQDKLDSDEKRAALKGKKIIFLAFDVPYDPVRDALLSQFKVVSSQYFPGYARLGITVYQLQ